MVFCMLIWGAACSWSASSLPPVVTFCCRLALRMAHSTHLYDLIPGLDSSRLCCTLSVVSGEVSLCTGLTCGLWVVEDGLLRAILQDHLSSGWTSFLLFQLASSQRNPDVL